MKMHILAQELLGKSSLEACSLSEIRELADSYPYYAPAQFLLLEKLRDSSDPAYTEQLQKSVLYYYDPLAFEYFISPDKFYTELKLDTLTNDRNDAGEKNISEPVPEVSISPILNVNTPVEAAVPNEPLAFEPFHTVDYFASQGIKLPQDEQPTDKFGKQLKSFTEWLKTMKRIPEQQISKNIDADSEKNVQHLAEDSVHDPLIWTESMAEVWIKQGNPLKAIEVYNKLSLLNPSKRAYFAAKIENIKT